jgi:hypothetical protein
MACALPLQACWSGQTQKYGAFLHSPLLVELKALESNAQRELAAVAEADAGGSDNEPPQAPDLLRRSAREAVERLRESLARASVDSADASTFSNESGQLRCAICLVTEPLARGGSDCCECPPCPLTCSSACVLGAPRLTHELCFRSALVPNA